MFVGAALAAKNANDAKLFFGILTVESFVVLPELNQVRAIWLIRG